VPAHLGPAGLETVDTLIMAGIADDRADAIRLVLPRFREQPEYEQLRERVREIDRLRAEFQLPTTDDRPGTSPQQAATPGQVWTVRP
jgi:hypothetical protein